MCSWNICVPFTLIQVMDFEWLILCSVGHIVYLQLQMSFLFSHFCGITFSKTYIQITRIIMHIYKEKKISN